MQDIKTEKAPKRRLAFSHTFITPLLVCAVFLLLLITETVRFDGIDMERGDAYLSLVAIQLFVFMLPSIFYIRYRSLDVREALRVRIPSPDKIMFMLLCAMILIITSILSSALTGQLGASIYSNRYISMADTESSADTYLYYAICFALVPALWVEIAPAGEYREIKDNMLPTEAFALGEIGWYKVKTDLYKSLIPNNVYTPVAYPAGWEVYKE